MEEKLFFAQKCQDNQRRQYWKKPFHQEWLSWSVAISIHSGVVVVVIIKKKDKFH